MEAFVEVVDRGGFTAAAERLGLSKSVVSRRVQQLESRLQTRLLHRSTRAMGLTDAGRQFHERCRGLLQELQDACEQASGRSGEVAGLLRVTAPASFAQVLMVPVLAALARRHPRLQVDLVLDERRLDLTGEAFDLAVRAGPLPDSTLRVRRLALLKGVVVASPAYLAAHGEPRSPAELAAHVGLHHRELAPQELWRFAAVDGTVSVVARFARRLQVNGFDALQALACAGIGIAVLPLASAAPALARGELVALLPEHRLQPHELSALYPGTREPSPKLAALLEALVEHAARPQAQWSGPA
ncbi:MAG: LysR family transcriptional regulator [Rubrivivax sp.]